MTNATLEQRTLDQYMKSGFGFNDAYRMTINDMVNWGFEPCIPKEAYGFNPSHPLKPGCETSYVGDIRKYDSYEVQRRNERMSGDIYKDFPTTQRAFLEGLKNDTLTLKTLPLGTFVVHPEYGTCEIVGYSSDPRNTKYKVPTNYVLAPLTNKDFKFVESIENTTIKQIRV